MHISVHKGEVPSSRLELFSPVYISLNLSLFTNPGSFSSLYIYIYILSLFLSSLSFLLFFRLFLRWKVRLLASNEGGSWFIRGYSFLTIESIRIVTKAWYLCVMKGGNRERGKESKRKEEVVVPSLRWILD